MADSVGEVMGESRPVRHRIRSGVVVAATLCVAVLAGWAVAHFSGQRTTGQTMTGGQPVAGAGRDPAAQADDEPGDRGRRGRVIG